MQAETLGASVSHYVSFQVPGFAGCGAMWGGGAELIHLGPGPLWFLWFKRNQALDN